MAGTFVGVRTQSVAMAAIYLAAKLEECPRRARDVVTVGHYLAVTRQGLPYEPMDFYGTVGVTCACSLNRHTF